MKGEFLTVVQKEEPITANMNAVSYCRASTTALNDLLFSQKGKSFTFSVDKPVAETRLEVVIYGTRTSGGAHQIARGKAGERAMLFIVADDFTSITSVDLRMLGKNDRYDDTTTILSNLQLEVGDIATEYEEYKPIIEYTPDEDHTCDVVSISPTMTLLTDTTGAVMDCEYNRDINKAFEQLTQAILSLGGNI